MRERKFRFWDSFNECYTYSDGFSLYEFFNLYEATKQGDNNPILEDWTTRKDKNNKDIYEGDIFRIEEEHELLEDDDGIYYIVITWVSEWCMFCALLIDEYAGYKEFGVEALDEPMFWTYTLEDTNRRKYFLCGNIHQNKNLLR